MKVLKEKEQFHYNANVQGFLLTKSQRINQRIEDLMQATKKLKPKKIATEDFVDTLKAIQILVAQELTNKGRVQNGKNA